MINSRKHVEADHRTTNRDGRLSPSAAYQIGIKYLAPIFLFFAPFWQANQGVDFIDTGYNLGNYAYYDTLGNTWKLGTYLANELARFFRLLPGGKTVLGMNLYTTLLVSGMALAGWYFCKRYVPAIYVFVAQLLAICLCWAPTVILYHYLTYFLFLFTVILLFEGIRRESRWHYLAAGFLLGMNVFARFSNLTETALILLVWYGCYLNYGFQRKKIAAATGWCVLGFAAGFTAVFATVWARFGWRAYTDMLFGMKNMESNASGYSVWDMLLGPWEEYARAIPWALLLILYALLGNVLLSLGKGRFEKGKLLLYLAGIPFLYRYFWGHAMFDLNYYSYGAIFWPCILLIMWSIGLCAVRIFQKNLSKVERLQTAMVFLLIWLTPLGSNNKNYPLFNNLFLILPFILKWTADLFWRVRKPVQIQMAVFALFFTVQTTLFGAFFVFGDGSYDEKRDTKIENSDILRGIYTSQSKQQTIETLTAYYQSLEEEVRLVTYGRIPGLAFYLGAEPAMGSTWPDLESYAMEDYEADLQRLETEKEHPLVLLNAELDEEDRQQEKYLRLQSFLQEHQYEKQFEVNGIEVFY